MPRTLPERRAIAGLAGATAIAGTLGFALWTSPCRAADAKPEIDFVTRASSANLAALAESRLAVDRAFDARVRAYAQRLVAAHADAETDLVNAAEGSGASVPTTLDRDAEARLATLEAMSGAGFDKAYVADQTMVHSNALTLYADYMLLGENVRLKTLAIKMIPITEAQFKDAQSLPGE